MTVVFPLLHGNVSFPYPFKYFFVPYQFVHIGQPSTKVSFLRRLEYPNNSISICSLPVTRPFQNAQTFCPYEANTFKTSVLFRDAFFCHLSVLALHCILQYQILFRCHVWTKRDCCFFLSFRVELLVWRSKLTIFTSKLNRLTQRKKHLVPWENMNWEPFPRELRYNGRFHFMPRYNSWTCFIYFSSWNASKYTLYNKKARIPRQ